MKLKRKSLGFDIEIDTDVVVNAWLAEHLWDDDQLVSDPWLSERFERDRKPTAFEPFSGTVTAAGAPSTSRSAVRITLAVDGHVSVSFRTSPSSSFNYLREGSLTRGDVRLLCRALGIPLEERS